MKKKYSITGIDCANCAAKLEAKMNELPEVESVTLSFTTQQLYVEAENPDEAVKALQALAAYNENPYDLDADKITFAECYEKWTEE